MEKMTWYEIVGEKLGLYKWCHHCYRMRWMHKHTKPIEGMDFKAAANEGAKRQV